MANDILIPGKRDIDGGTKTTVVRFKNRLIRLETVRVGQKGSLYPKEPHAQIRDLDCNGWYYIFHHNEVGGIFGTYVAGSRDLLAGKAVQTIRYFGRIQVKYCQHASKGSGR